MASRTGNPPSPKGHPVPSTTRGPAGSRRCQRRSNRLLSDAAGEGISRRPFLSCSRGLFDEANPLRSPGFRAPQASVVLQRSPSLAEAAERGELASALRSAFPPPTAGPTGRRDPEGIAGEYLLRVVDGEVVGELRTGWDEAVKKWR